MDKKKTLKAAYAAVVLICLFIAAGAVYETHIVATFAVVGVALVYAVKQIKELGE